MKTNSKMFPRYPAFISSIPQWHSQWSAAHGRSCRTAEVLQIYWQIHWTGGDSCLNYICWKKHKISKMVSQIHTKWQIYHQNMISLWVKCTQHGLLKLTPVTNEVSKIFKRNFTIDFEVFVCIITNMKNIFEWKIQIHYVHVQTIYLEYSFWTKMTFYSQISFYHLLSKLCQHCLHQTHIRYFKATP